MRLSVGVDAEDGRPLLRTGFGLPRPLQIKFPFSTQPLKNAARSALLSRRLHLRLLGRRVRLCSPWRLAEATQRFDQRISESSRGPLPPSADAKSALMDLASTAGWISAEAKIAQSRLAGALFHPCLVYLHGEWRVLTQGGCSLSLGF